MSKHFILPALSIILLLSAASAHAQVMISGTGATSPEKSSTPTNVDTSIERRPQVGPNSNTGLTITTPALGVNSKSTSRGSVNTDVQSDDRTGVRTGSGVNSSSPSR